MLRKSIKKIVWGVFAMFLLLNIIAAFHAWKFTHFTEETTTGVVRSMQLSTGEKINAAFFGINNRRPVQSAIPTQVYETVKIEGEKPLEAWFIKSDGDRGTVILFHGYKGEKSAMLARSDEFLKLGFHTLLLDFRGSGGSEGNQTTIGYDEAEDVKASYDWLAQKGEQHIYLFGTSMGAVAIMKALHDYALAPEKVMLECPFGTMYETVCARFDAMDAPIFPMAGLLMFWGGLENGFWAFSHNPEDYATTIKVPALLMYGEKDNRVSRQETDAIFNNLAGPKQLATYPLAGHESYLAKYREKWLADVTGFLNN